MAAWIHVGGVFYRVADGAKLDAANPPNQVRVQKQNGELVAIVTASDNVFVVISDDVPAAVQPGQV